MKTKPVVDRLDEKPDWSWLNAGVRAWRLDLKKAREGARREPIKPTRPAVTCNYGR